MTIVMADGSVRSMTPQRVSAGCDVKLMWRGLITDSERYVWDLH
jgi:hypothetical protein